MPQLVVVLGHGFVGEPVTVLVDGEVVLQREDVRTRMQIDRADAFEVPARAEGRRVEVQLPRRGTQGATDVRAGGTATLRVDVGEDGRPRFALHEGIAGDL